MSEWTGSTDPTTTETTTSYIPDSTTQYSWIFSFGAGNAEVKSKKSGNKAFVFDPDDGTNIVAFSDRADRFIGSMNLKKLAKQFKTYYEDSDLPEGVITSYQDDENGIIMLSQLKMSRKRMGSTI